MQTLSFITITSGEATPCTLFLIGIVLLIIGYFTYGKLSNGSLALKKHALHQLMQIEIISIISR